MTEEETPADAVRDAVPDSNRDPAQANKAIVDYWLKQIESARTWHKDFFERGKKVHERYLDSREGVASENAHRMNILWSNIETTKPALYMRTPKPKVKRRNGDKDPVGRWAAIVLERALSYSLDAQDFDYEMRAAVSDYLLPGRGQIWECYEPVIVQTGMDANGQPLERVEWENCLTRHVHWRDFLTNPARSWSEVWWVAKRAYLTRKDGVARFGDKFNSVSLDHPRLRGDSEEFDSAQGDPRDNKAEVWEIWCKTDARVYFITASLPEPLQVRAPWVKFARFFPCPRPIAATTTTDSILPSPDFTQYQDLAAEIDRLTQKINALSRSLKIVGLYNGEIEELETLLTVSDNTMIPCEKWALFQQDGAFNGAVAFFPIEQVVAALKYCYEAREQAKQAMYEITGISDIVRGASDPHETLGAQQIKTQWGGLRIRDRQRELQRFARDVVGLKAEIIATTFSLQTLRQMSNVPLLMEAEKQAIRLRMSAAAGLPTPGAVAAPVPLSPEEQTALKEPSWEQVMALLRNSRLRGFQIDIETDSTLQADEQQEKADRTEFIKAVTSFIREAGPVLQAAPQLGNLMGELLMFGVRGFKAGETLETEIQDAVDMLDQARSAPAVAPNAAHLPPPNVMPANAGIQSLNNNPAFFRTGE